MRVTSTSQRGFGRGLFYSEKEPCSNRKQFSTQRGGLEGSEVGHLCSSLARSHRVICCISTLPSMDPCLRWDFLLTLYIYSDVVIRLACGLKTLMISRKRGIAALKKRQHTPCLNLPVWDPFHRHSHQRHTTQEVPAKTMLSHHWICAWKNLWENRKKCLNGSFVGYINTSILGEKNMMLFNLVHWTQFISRRTASPSRPGGRISEDAPTENCRDVHRRPEIWKVIGEMVMSIVSLWNFLQQISDRHIFGQVKHFPSEQTLSREFIFQNLQVHVV